jgi:hypothetical protein
MAFQDERIKILPSENGPWPGLKVHDKESALGKCLGTQTHSHKSGRLAKEVSPKHSQMGITLGIRVLECLECFGPKCK